jgi:DNA gyrase inhibitor GyrI
MSLHLTHDAEPFDWPPTHYVYVERLGAFTETAPEAWGYMHGLVPELETHNRITGYLSLYNAESKQYRAGVSVDAPPAALPEGLSYVFLPGGAYRRFILSGPYDDLPEANSRVFETIEAEHIKLRDDFFIERYATDPRLTPPERSITEILVPLG